MFVALYTYKGSHSRTLSFTVGAQFVEAGSSRDANWLHVINECGCIGYVPKNYVGQHEVTLSEHLDFIDGCIEGIHLRKTENNGTISKGDEDALQKLTKLRASLGSSNQKASTSEKLTCNSSVTKRPAPKPPSQDNRDSTLVTSMTGLDVSSNSNLHNAADVSGDRNAHNQNGEKENEPERVDGVNGVGEEKQLLDVAAASNSHPEGRQLLDVNTASNSHPEKRQLLDIEAASKMNTEERQLLDVEAASKRLPEGVLKRMVDDVRESTQVSYLVSQQVIEIVLQSLSTAVPQLEPITKRILSEPLESPLPTSTSASWWKLSADASKAISLLDKLRECKDDDQQRSWALHEDLNTISQHLSELIEVMNHGDLVAVREVLTIQDYQPLLTLVQYYQMEVRRPLRQLLLDIFSLSCQMSGGNVSYLSTTILPVEMARELLSPDLDVDTQCSVARVLSMVLSGGDALPYTHYSIINSDFVSHLLKGIEESGDSNESLCGSYLTILLELNGQEWIRTGGIHQADGGDCPSRHILLQELSKAESVSCFVEKLLLHFNREDDPVQMFDHSDDSCHSVNEMMVDLYSSSLTSTLLYTNDERVLCDIIIRQLTDLSHEDVRRDQYLRLCVGVMERGRWGEHLHRVQDLKTCLLGVVRAKEDAPEMVQKIEHLLETSELFESS